MPMPVDDPQSTGMPEDPRSCDRTDWMEPWLEAMDAVRPLVGLDFAPALPVKVLDHLYLGDLHAAESVEQLQRLGITHVLNMTHNAAEAKYGDIEHFMLGAEDKEEYDMLQHLPAAASYIDAARSSGGRVLVHCKAGINRSGFVAVAEVMVHNQVSVLSAFRKCRDARGPLLTNHSFRRQLLSLAKEHDLMGIAPQRRSFNSLVRNSVPN